MADPRATIRFASRLRRYLSTPLDAGAGRRAIAERLRGRETALLEVLAGAVYARPSSVYARLLAHAGVERGDLEAMLNDEGLEAALRRLHGAGVWVGLDEFRGRRVLRRGSLEIATRPEDFDNPLLSASWAGRTGGSRSAGRPVLIDLDLLAYEAAHHAMFLEAFGFGGRPYAVWLPAPPGVAGLKNVLRHAKLGHTVERWFSQHRARSRADGVVSALVPAALRAARALGSPLPVPEHVSIERAELVAKWLGDHARAGHPGLLETNASSAVRVASIALKHGVEFAGSVLRVGGEPYTAAKAEVLHAAGARVACHYSMSEVGRIGLSCAAPRALDDVHFLADKLALLQPRPHEPLLLTTLLRATPKLLINVQVDDRATVEERDCGCVLGELGLRTHLHEIRSDEKLTTEGTHFLGAGLMRLVEEALPRRFGGGAGDYQLVEIAEGLLARVEVWVAPEVGALNEEDVKAAVIAFLGEPGPGERMMAARLRDARTLRVRRRRPEPTAGGKVLPVRVTR